MKRCYKKYFIGIFPSVCSCDFNGFCLLSKRCYYQKLKNATKNIYISKEYIEKFELMELMK
jgi:hypothetical protein